MGRTKRCRPGKMASRSSRSSAKEPISGSAFKKERDTSPLSPTKISRTEEKKQLGHLNDRLAAYIDRVRSLELENGKLEKQMCSFEETSTREITTMRSAYDKELAHARRALDDTSKEKARLEMDAEKAKTECREIKQRFKEKEDEISRLGRSNKHLEAQNIDLRNKAETALDEVRSLKPEFENMKNKLEDARQKLEDETLKRIDLQNQLLTMQEENAFSQNILEQQLNDTKVRKQIEIEEVDSRVQNQYEEKLSQSLKELRDSYEQQMLDNRAGFSAIYDKKINDLNAKLSGERGSAASAIQEMKEMQTKVEGMTSRVSELETTNSALNRRIKELTDQIDDLGRVNRADIARKDHEIDYLNEQLNSLTKEYQELLEIKIALDMEIAAYQKLLDGEETRLGLSPDSRVSGRGIKRKRMDVEESYIGIKMNTSFNQPGVFLIEPLEESRNCITITNTGDEEETLAGHVLKCQSAGVESTFKFTRNHKVAPGGAITVWSSDSGVDHDVGSGQLVMKSGAWKMGEDEVNTVLVSKEGDEVAARETTWEKQVTGSRLQFSGDAGSSVLAARQAEGEKCVIM